MQSLFEAILSTNLINFIIVISTLVWIFKKFNLAALIDKMAQDIQTKVEKSSYDAKTALDEYRAVKKATKDTPKLQEEIINNAKKNAADLKENIKNQADLKSEEIISSLEKTNLALIEKYKKLTVSDIYTSCIDIAQDVILERLDDSTHKKLINSSIDELDKIEGGL